MMSSDAVVPSMDPNSNASSRLEMSSSSYQSENTMKGVLAASAGDHMMSTDDPDNPQNWPIQKKVYVSSVAFAFSWVVYVAIMQVRL